MTAIVSVLENSVLTFKKYRNIRDEPGSVEKFENMVRKKFPGVRYINYYLKTGETFVKRVYL
jgi:hypothetical protein